MTIRTKLIIGFLLPIVLLAGFFGYVFKEIREFYLDTTKTESIRLTKEISKRINSDIMLKLEEIHRIAEIPFIIEIVSEENKNFDQIENIKDVIAKRDSEWTSVPDEKVTDFMKDLINRGYSQYLRKIYMDQPLHNTGYTVFGEIFITNKFGVNIFQTSKTTDYMQGDEEWWKSAKKDGLFIGGIEYDESVKNYSISVAMRITDENDEFVGVVKAVIRIIELIRQIDIFTQKFGSHKIMLVTGDGRLVYSSSPYQILEDVSEKDFYKFTQRAKPYYSSKDDKLYTTAPVLEEIQSNEKLSWRLIAQHNSNVVLKPVDNLQRSFFIFSLVLIIIGILIALFISFTISKPIIKLKETVYKFGKGELGTRVNHADFKSEIGQLALSFNEMADSLQKAIADLDEEINIRKQAEEAFKESEERYRVLFDQSRDGINIFTSDKRILDVNKKIVELTGYSKEELLTMGLQDIYSPAKSETKKRIAEMSKGVDSKLFEVDLITKSGARIPVEIGATGLKNFYGNKIVFQGNIRDISERRRIEKEKEKLETQLRQSHKLEAIGTLTGGIAHDFNNILGIIIGNIELTIDEVPDWNPGRLNLEEAKLACLRAKDVVRQLLNFSRKSEHKRKPVKIHSIITESIALLRASIPTTIRIQSNFEDNLGIINADPTQVHQVLINLCTNGAHAMEEKGGILEIGLSQIELDEETQIEFQSLESGKYIQLTVNDNGSGIDSEILERVFDPYFTTKDIGKGSGMGLAVVHGIMKNHDGAVSLKSEPGKGTTVKVLFPVVDDSPQPEKIPTGEIPGGNERILFIDDEEGLIKIGKQMLEKLGYHVEIQTDPTKALELIHSNPNLFDLVITDMTMPQMTGYELAKEILTTSPKMPIILCTGFSKKVNGKSASEMGIRMCIEKPLNKQKLAIAVREVLDGND